MYGLCQRSALRCLLHRLPAGDRQTVEQRVCSIASQQRRCCFLAAACRVVRLRIVAAGTAVRTALHKQRIAEAGAVHNGLPDCTCNADFTFHQAVCS